MWNFIKSLLSNRFGIVLATLNVCFFMLVAINDVLVTKMSTVLILCLNAPALVITKLFYEVLLTMFYSTNQYMSVNDLSLLISGFIFAQWLLIGWLSKIIAQKISDR